MIAASIPPLLLAAAGILLVSGVVIYVLARRSADAGPDIPPAFMPGPSDTQLEKPRLEKLQAWGIVLVALSAVWIPAYFIFEPEHNKNQEALLTAAAIEHGSREVQVQDAHSNPEGVGCVSCHGTALTGQEVLKGGLVFKSADLTTVCSRLTQEEIRMTVSEGRGNMPAWSVENDGPLNDQQINDVVAYVVNLNSTNGKVPFADNKCSNPEAAAPESPAASPSASPTEGKGSTGEATASPQADTPTEDTTAVPTPGQSPSA